MLGVQGSVHVDPETGGGWLQQQGLEHYMAIGMHQADHDSEQVAMLS
jgi:hypothetical protein